MRHAIKLPITATLALGAVLAVEGCEQVESPLVELDRPAMLAKVREAHDMSARLHGPDAHAVAHDEWGMPLDQALARVNHLLVFWSETLGPYPAPGETYMRFGRDGEQIEDFAHMAGQGNCDQRASISLASSSARVSGGGLDEVLVSGSAATTSSVEARHSISGLISTAEGRLGADSLHGHSDCDWRGSARRAWSFPTPEDETVVCVDVDVEHRVVSSADTSFADTRNRECGTFGGRDDDGGGWSCAGNDECTYPGSAVDYPDVGSGFTCYWVADDSDTDDGGYWLCLRGS